MSDMPDTGIARRIAKNRKRRKRQLIVKLIILVIIIAAVVTGVVVIAKHWSGGGQTGEPQATPSPDPKAAMENLVREADFLAAGYDYDAAIEKIKSFGEDYASHQELADAIAGYEATKAKMVRYEDVTQITHVFFHTLIVDSSKAFDGEYTEAGYNQYMTTIDEFNKMLEEMYKRNFVLVSIRDIAHEETQEDGTTKFVPGDIMLPPGKKPFVMSQDDVCYYEYMQPDGFARRIVIGDDGYPTCEYVQDDGTVVTGDYDLVPLLENFIQQHPDFSYRGARAILALTGYEGVLGYRSYAGSSTQQEDAAAAKAVADRMKELGWEFASHSWGHQKYGKVSAAKAREDAQRWKDEVEPIVGPTEIMIYANGDDIAGIGKYQGEKYDMLKEMGFKYFCNVDSSQYWVQIRDDYVRQGRRNLDGYRMWYQPERLEDLFNVDDVWDKSRPVPVPPI